MKILLFILGILIVLIGIGSALSVYEVDEAINLSQYDSYTIPADSSSALTRTLDTYGFIKSFEWPQNGHCMENPRTCTSYQLDLFKIWLYSGVVMLFGQLLLVIGQTKRGTLLKAPWYLLGISAFLLAFGFFPTLSKDIGFVLSLLTLPLAFIGGTISIIVTLVLYIRDWHN